ncbi:MAG: DNA-directed RNA polymerase subunit P [Candidatus Aenigmarchaeota archaeon]|nr:DNA-directed RNA polymerase subunit P [Candidatus Aenigmarchaeota archaeon]
MEYKCLNCGKNVQLDLKSAKRVICQFCGHRMLIKIRPKIAKRVVAK